MRHNHLGLHLARGRACSRDTSNCHIHLALAKVPHGAQTTRGCWHAQQKIEKDTLSCVDQAPAVACGHCSVGEGVCDVATLE